MNTIVYNWHTTCNSNSKSNEGSHNMSHDELDIILEDDGERKIRQGIIGLIDQARQRGMVSVGAYGSVTFDTNARRFHSIYYKLIEALRVYPKGIDQLKKDIIRLYR